MNFSFLKQTVPCFSQKQVLLEFLPWALWAELWGHTALSPTAVTIISRATSPTSGLSRESAGRLHQCSATV